VPNLIYVSCLLGIVLTVASASRGQAPVAPTVNHERAEKTISRRVVRITARVEVQPKPLEGTGFIVAVPDDRLPGMMFVYLVTNRHVAQAIFPNSEGQPIAHRVLEMNAILNLKQPVDGTRSHDIPLPPKGPGAWYFPADRAIDLALIPIPLSDTYDFTYIATGLFLTPDTWDKLRVVPGDKLLTCGYFLHYAGAHQFQPILRE
jgi:hypothetical protein